MNQGHTLHDETLTFLQKVAVRGVRFFLEDGKLKSSGTDALTPAEREFVRANKAELITQLLPQTQSIPAAEPGDEEPAPLSHQQERLWLLHEIAERSEEYNSVTLLAVRGPFDPVRFGTALRRVVAENDVLRTVFRTTGDTVQQVVSDAEPWIHLVDAESAESAYDTARAGEHAEANHQFDLRQEVPVRCRVISAPQDLHYIVLNIHHIACDGWSISLILDRLSACYEDPDGPPAPPARTYRDYARWQRRTLRGDVLDALLGKWTERLADAPPAHALPADFAPDPSAARQGGVVRHRVDADTYAAFRELCVAEGANEFAGLHAVLGMLLARISGQEETVVGSPIANREQQAIHSTVGFFVNMISVRGAVDDGAAFRDVLALKKAETDFGYAFQQAPFEQVAARLTEQRQKDTTPVFQVVLVLQNNRVARPRFGGAVAEELPEVHHHNRFDLEIFVHGSGQEDRELEWVYNSRMFEATTVERWAAWFAALLAEVTDNPGRPTADLEALTAAPPTGRDHGDTSRDREDRPGTGIDVLGRIRAVAAEDPGRIAVGDDVRNETYADLLAGGRRIGAALLELYGPGGVYAVCMERSVELVRSLVGIMSIGATYVMLDPDDTSGRRAAVVESSGPCCLLVAEDPAAHGGPSGQAGPDVLDVRTLAAADVPGHLPGDTPADRDLYYVFTSGSTGRPKGVRVTYGNLAAYLGGVVPRLALPDGAAHCWHSSPATDFGNTVVFGALATGGRLEIATREDILDGAAMSAFLRDRAIDVLKITPSHLEALLDTHPVDALLPRATLILGGEAASPAVVRALRDVPPSVAVFNHYGPSETTVGVFVAELADRTDERVFPIGHPLPGIDFSVETEQGHDAPFGVAGELVLRGPQVAAGYLEQPAAGADPFFVTGTERGYRTGDWVRRRNDGQLVFLGRRDSQVKIRGHRVELGEIKAALESVAGVARSEVLIDREEGQPPSVVAFVQRDDAGAPTAETSRADAAATVDQWREFYDYAYSERVSGDPEFNISGWISSYTGERIPEEQMREWLAVTLDHISALRPRNVLEIGCGLGIIAYPLSRSVESYLACDFSAEIIAANRANAERIDTGELTFFECEALDIDQHVDRIREAGVDTVIINSVVQYFPDAAYLDAVLDKVLAIDCVRNVFVGDVRNYDLLDEFSLSLVDSRGDHPHERSNIERLRLARQESDQTTELLVSDLYWSEFAGNRRDVAGVSVLPRTSSHSNELFDFRYDVVLTKDADTLGRPAAPDNGVPPSGGPDRIDELVAELTGGAADVVVVRGLRNPRTAAHCDALRSIRSGVGGSGAPRSAAVPAGADPELARIRAVAEEHGLHAGAHYARDEHGYVSRLDVALFRGGTSGLADSRLLGASPSDRRRALVNVPAVATAHGAWTDVVRTEIAHLLPRHMCPDQVVEVPAFPLNRTGKVDRQALRALIPRHDGAGLLGELAGETEERIAGILVDLLGPGTRVDRDSDFFAVGGHSLLATKYVHAVNQAFGTRLRVKSVFDRPRLRDFAELVADRHDEPPRPAAPAAGATGPLSVSPLQQRFWTMARLSGPSTLYNSLMLLDLTGPLAPDALKGAFTDVVAHHRVLRAHFEAVGDAVVLRTRGEQDFALAHLEVPGLDREGAERILCDRLNRPFDLETGPLLDAALISVSPERHFLAMAVHHAIFDGASEDIVVRDLEACYTARLEGREPRWEDDGDGFLRHLAEAPRPTAESVDYWVRRLAGAPALHGLPLDHERPERATAQAGAAVHAVYGSDTTDLVTALARRHQTTAFVVLNAFVALFTSFLSGDDDVVIGSPVDCRETADDNRAVGMYVNTVAFRHRLDWQRPLDGLIAEAKDFFHEAFAHMTTPFDRLVEALDPQRLPGVNPVFQIMLALQPEGTETFRFHTCEGRSLKTATEQSKFDLTLNAKVIDGRLNVYWEYSRELFTADRIERMAALFESFVRTAASSPELPLAEHRFTTAAGAGSPVALLTGPAVPLPDASWLDAFARQVAAHGDRPAIRTGDGDTWDYRTLDARSDALAALLHDKGVRAGDLVAVALRRSAESPATLLAVNKLGAAYVPMDSEYLRQRAPELTREHRIVCAVVEDDDAKRDFGPAVTVPRGDFPGEGAPTAFPAAEVRGTDLCYVIFTSGSTGTPKGVAVRHRSVVNYLAHCSATYLTHRPDTAVVASPLSFDATVTTTLFGMAAGLTLRLVDEGEELTGLCRTLLGKADGRLLLKLTPSHLVALSNLGATRETRDDRHTFVLGGEDLRASAIAPWYRALPESSFFNEYGPTEATVGCLIHRVTAEDIDQGSVRIGTPICNTTVAVLARGSLCVPDQRGEIVIMGEGLARGYLDDAQTRAAFRPVPGLDGAVGYYSGDLASLSGAALRYHGRRTREIKIRGFRVSLPEIEAAIGDLADVADCACGISSDGRSLTAYVVPAGSAPRTRETEARIRDAVRGRLPGHMVPDTLQLLAELPLTANGKVDLDRLAREAARPAAVAPSGATDAEPVARRLHAVWQEVLNASGELPTDVAFFSLGGNSLTLTHLLRRLNEEFGAELPLESLYRAVTLRDQVALLSTATPAAQRGPEEPVAAVDATREVELTPAQRRLFLLEKLGSGADYVNPVCFRIDPGVDVTDLVTAVEALLDRHPVLKSRVAERGEHLMLLPGSGVPAAAHVTVVPCEDDAEAERRMLEARDTAVNIFGGPLFRAFCHPLPDGALHLQMIVHHVVFDGWSEKILLDDLVALYDGVRAGRTPDAARPVPFQEYAAGRVPESVEADTRWWIDALTGAPAAHNLPVRERGRTDREQPAASLHRVLSGTDMAALDEGCRRLGVTPFTVVHTALALAVCNMSNEDDVVVGVPTANRGDTRYHGTVGLFMETLPLRTTVGGGDTTFEDLVRANRATLTEALARADFRIEEVLNACAPHRDGTRNPLYQIMLSFNDEGGEGLRLGGAEARRRLLPARAAKLDLIVDAKIIDGALNLFWEYDTGLLTDETATALVEHFEDWLRWGLSGPQRRLREFTRPGPEPAPEPDRRPSSYERFVAAWEGRDRDLAYTEDGTALTAGQLHSRVAALADRLAAGGLGRKSVVACLSGRVLDHVIAFLACSRMGAVHVPLDTSNPPERIRAILEQCDADAVVAETARAVPQPYPAVTTDGLPDDLTPAPAAPSSPVALSHVMFTSGSTGRPKGVRISNAALDSYVTGINGAYGIRDAAVAQCGNPAYDVFVEELALSVLVGNRMAVLPPQQRAEPSAFARFVERENVELLPLPTSYWAFLVGAMTDADFDRLRRVKVCAVGGEDYPPAAARTWFERFGDIPRLFNVYGPTENGPVSLVSELRPDTPPSTLGTPLGEVRCEVRSRFGAAVPAGGRGELWLLGPQLFSGYIGGAPVEEYPTGDIVLVDAVHGYRFVERAGSMMKISGFRVEPGEYTALLKDVPGVEDVRVTANERRTGVTVYALLDGTDAPEPEIAETVGTRLRTSLPRYMRGYELRFCRTIPLTPNGKADFKALRDISWAAPDPARSADGAGEGPREDVAQVWRAVLATNQLDEHRGFFDHGGTSMTLLRLHSLLNERFPGCFELIDLYEKPSIDLQARHIHERSRTGDDTTPSGPTARERLALKRRARRATGGRK
jgi:amino acid adenylation domain-containing protein